MAQLRNILVNSILCILQLGILSPVEAAPDPCFSSNQIKLDPANASSPAIGFSIKVDNGYVDPATICNRLIEQRQNLNKQYSDWQAVGRTTVNTTAAGIPGNAQGTTMAGGGQVALSGAAALDSSATNLNSNINILQGSIDQAKQIGALLQKSTLPSSSVVGRNAKQANEEIAEQIDRSSKLIGEAKATLVVTRNTEAGVLRDGLAGRLNNEGLVTQSGLEPDRTRGLITTGGGRRTETTTTQTPRPPEIPSDTVNTHNTATTSSSGSDWLAGGLGLAAVGAIGYGISRPSEKTTVAPSTDPVIASTASPSTSTITTTDTSTANTISTSPPGTTSVTSAGAATNFCLQSSSGCVPIAAVSFPGLANGSDVKFICNASPSSPTVPSVTNCSSAVFAGTAIMVQGGQFLCLTTGAQCGQPLVALPSNAAAVSSLNTPGLCFQTDTSGVCSVIPAAALPGLSNGSDIRYVCPVNASAPGTASTVCQSISYSGITNVAAGQFLCIASGSQCGQLLAVTTGVVATTPAGTAQAAAGVTTQTSLTTTGVNIPNFCLQTPSTPNGCTPIPPGALPVVAGASGAQDGTNVRYSCPAQFNAPNLPSTNCQAVAGGATVTKVTGGGFLCIGLGLQCGIQPLPSN